MDVDRVFALPIGYRVKNRRNRKIEYRYEYNNGLIEGRWCVRRIERGNKRGFRFVI